MKSTSSCLLLLPLFAFTADTWQPFAIDSRVSLQLPTHPTELDFAKLAPTRKPDHTRIWLLRAPEGTYQVIRLPNNSTISSTDTAGRRAFYTGVLTSVMRNESGQLLLITPFPTSAGAGMEYKYKAMHKGTGKHVIKYTRILLADSIAYTLNFVPIDRQDSLGIAGAAQRRRFFDSITVKP
jgi:hypothetical protein